MSTSKYDNSFSENTIMCITQLSRAAELLLQPHFLVGDLLCDYIGFSSFIQLFTESVLLTYILLR